MKLNSDNALPPSSRVWIYAADRIFTEQEASEIDAMMKSFAAQWAAHKEQLAADAGLFHNCFLVIMADESMTGASGCSIDASVRFVKEIGTRFQADFFNRKLIYVLTDSNKINIQSFDEASQDYATGMLKGDTKVFNHLIATKADLQNRWVVKLSESPLNHFITAPQPAFKLSL